MTPALFAASGDGCAMSTQPYWLNVGGVQYAVSRETLCMAGGFLKGIADNHRNGDEVFIDRNGSSFALLLDFVRSGILPDSMQMLKYLSAEADFFCLPGMSEEIEKRMSTLQQEPNTQADVAQSLRSIANSLKRLEKTRA